MTFYSPTLEELRAEIDQTLISFLQDLEDGLSEAPFLIDEIERCVASGGKRLRPCFCYWGFRAAGRSHGEEIVKAAAALELLHTFALVHDDVMDDATERRGQPTTVAKHGLDAAILVGDLALVLADELLLRSGFGSEVLVEALRIYSRMRQHVIAGQHLDVTAAQELSVSEASARRIAVLKAGLYTVEEPLLIGARLGAASDEVRQGLSAFGRPLGEAFQLRDDLLSTFGDSKTGKPVDSDIRQGKRHVLFALAAEALDGEERHFLLSRWGAPGLDAAEIRKLRSLLDSSGARAGTQRLLDDLESEARKGLSELDVDGPSRAALADLLERCVSRHA